MQVLNFATHRPASRTFAGLLRELVDSPASIQLWIGIVTLFSFATTAYGLALLYSDRHGVGWLGVVLPVAVAGIMHATILAILAHAAATRSLAAFLVALPLQAVPAALSTATHHQHLNGRLGFARSADTEAAAVRIAIATRAAAERAVLARIAELKAHSSERAEVEMREGNTCGTASGVGASYRAELRRSDAIAFAAMWEGAKARTEHVGHHLQRAEALAFQGSGEEIAASVARLTRIVEAMRGDVEGNPEYRIVEGQLGERLRRRDFPIPDRFRKPGGPSTFSCPDERLERGIRAALAAMDAVPKLPDVKVIDTTDAKVALDQALGRIGAWLAGGPGAAPLLAGDKAALGLAVAVEALMTLAFLVQAVIGSRCAPLSSAALRHRLSLAAEEIDGPREIASILEAARASVGSPLTLLAPWCVWRRGGLEVAIPTARLAEPAGETALLFCEKLVGIGLAVPAQGVLQRGRAKRRYWLGDAQLTELLGNGVLRSARAGPVGTALRRVA